MCNSPSGTLDAQQHRLCLHLWRLAIDFFLLLRCQAPSPSGLVAAVSSFAACVVFGPELSTLIGQASARSDSVHRVRRRCPLKYTPAASGMLLWLLWSLAKLQQEVDGQGSQDHFKYSALDSLQ